MSRNTQQKQVVLRTIQEMPGHQTADAVYAQVHQELPTISRATVFRILSTLADQGVLRRVNALDRALIYDKRCDPHGHIRCVRCGDVADLELPPGQDLCALAPAELGYRVTGYDLVLHGLCSACAGQSAMGTNRESLPK